MNSCDRSAPQAESIANDELMDGLLTEIRSRFYATQHAAAFHRDRRRLLHAVSWPAVWLDRRGLFCSPRHYRLLVVARLDAIRAHGDPAHYGAYFPTYLLKCLQDHFDRHGDELDAELKHIGHALDLVVGSLRFADKAQAHSRQIEAIAQVHRFLRAQAPPPSDPNQLALF